MKLITRQEIAEVAGEVGTLFRLGADGAGVFRNGGVGRAISIDLLAQSIAALEEVAGERPDLIACSSLLCTRIAQLYGRGAYYVREVWIGGKERRLPAGYEALAYRYGSEVIPILSTRACVSEDGVLLINFRRPNAAYCGVIADVGGY